MRSVTRIRIAAPAERIFELGAQVERWPQILPHYRYVRRLDDPDGERRFEMGARRGPLPVRWEAIQRLQPEARRIEFLHTGGVTRGMQVVWRIEPDGDAHEVRIEHELELGWPLVGGLVAEHVIGPHFIEAIARRTLRRIKQLAEANGVAR